MISLDVIGDSYSDENHYCIKGSTEIRKDDSSSYLELLRNNYKFEINNYSWNGIGATQAIERLINIKNRNRFLLFFLPQIKRVKFNYFEDENVCNNYVQYKQNKLPKDIELDYDAIYSSNILDYYETLCVSFVFSYRKIYDKILLWPISKYDFIGINELPKNCHLIEKHLEEISYEETFQIKKDTSVDTRNNHLSTENHMILTEMIYDFFINDIIPDESSFVKNCDNSNNSENFIYE